MLWRIGTGQSRMVCCILPLDTYCLFISISKFIWCLFQRQQAHYCSIASHFYNLLKLLHGDAFFNHHFSLLLWQCIISEINIHIILDSCKYIFEKIWQLYVDWIIWLDLSYTMFLCTFVCCAATTHCVTFKTLILAIYIDFNQGFHLYLS